MGLLDILEEIIHVQEIMNNSALNVIYFFFSLYYMDYLIIDTCKTYSATGQVLTGILYFMNHYINQNNINLSDINNIYVNKCSTICGIQSIFDNNFNTDNIIKLYFNDTSFYTHTPILSMPNNNNYVYIIKKIKFSSKVLKYVENYEKKFDNNTIGVHFRMTDMNAFHTKTSPVKYQDYATELNNYIKKYNIKTIYVFLIIKKVYIKSKKIFYFKIVIFYIQILKYIIVKLRIKKI